MLNAGMTPDSLRDCLAATAPCELLGMTLLRASRQFYPPDLPRETLKEAVVEIIAYTGRCAAAAQRLHTLTPVALTSVSILEYGL